MTSLASLHWSRCEAAKRVYSIVLYQQSNFLTEVVCPDANLDGRRPSVNRGRGYAAWSGNVKARKSREATRKKDVENFAAGDAWLLQRSLYLPTDWMVGLDAR